MLSIFNISIIFIIFRNISLYIRHISHENKNTLFMFNISYLMIEDNNHMDLVISVTSVTRTGFTNIFKKIVAFSDQLIYTSLIE